MSPQRSDPRVERWVRRALAAAPLKAKSLVVTVWGDSIAPHGGAVWLGGLIALLAPFGINERLVRTSVFRLAQDGWLDSRQDGRRSLYRLTTLGQRRFEHAYRRIYAPPPTDPWDGGWHLVIVPPAAIDAVSRRELRKELQWDGFGVLGPGMFARPVRPGNEVALRETTRALGMDGRVAVVVAHAVPQEARSLPQRARESLSGARAAPHVANGAGAMPQRTHAATHAAEGAAGSIAGLSAGCWDLKGVAAGYRGFVARFSGLRQALDQGAEPTSQQCFLLRTLLIHQFRRVTLHDPQLPVELLPKNWPETAAYALCRDLYRSTHERAEEHLSETLEMPNAALRPVAPALHERFGGLQR